MLNEKLLIGVIQTSLDDVAAWQRSTETDQWQRSVQISKHEEKRARKEIRHFLSSLNNMDGEPDVIVFPELAVPLGFERRLRSIAEGMQTIIIAGLDYQIENISPPTVSNEAIIVVPRKLRGKRISQKTESRRIGKTYPSPAEKKKLNEINVRFQSRPTVWLFESDTLGSFGVAVCYDFLDIDRIALYRDKIQTLFILAYNRDTNTFHHSAEAIARMVFCNVVVCNCGRFGGSLAISPYRESYERTIYNHCGLELPNAQLIQLPLRSLAAHQKSGIDTKTYKSLPPGFDK